MQSQFWLENVKVRQHLGDLNTDGRTVYNNN
jgi:hypothetical protein